MLPRWSLEASKTYPGNPKSLPRRPKMTPKRLQEAPKPFQDVPSSTQDAPKTSPRRPKSKKPQVAPRTSQYTPKPLHKSNFEGFRKVWERFSYFRALATCRKCEIEFRSKFESKVPSSICQSHCVNQVSSTDDGGLRVAVSMRGGSPPSVGDLVP